MTKIAKKVDREGANICDDDDLVQPISVTPTALQGVAADEFAFVNFLAYWGHVSASPTIL